MKIGDMLIAPDNFRDPSHQCSASGLDRPRGIKNTLRENIDPCGGIAEIQNDKILFRKRRLKMPHQRTVCQTLRRCHDSFHPQSPEQTAVPINQFFSRGHRKNIQSYIRAVFILFHADHCIIIDICVLVFRYKIMKFIGKIHLQLCICHKRDRQPSGIGQGIRNDDINILHVEVMLLQNLAEKIG